MDKRGEKTEYMRGWRERQRGLDDESIAARQDDGPCAKAVAAELASLSGAQDHQGLAEACMVLAADIDNPKLATTHPSAVRQLQLSLDTIRNASHVARGKLASVAEMSRRKPPAKPRKNQTAG